jgi:hypothetical protein
VGNLESRHVASAAAPGMKERVDSLWKEDISGELRAYQCVSSLAFFSDWNAFSGRNPDAFRWKRRLVWEC